jgi:predicted aspartyl protease
MGVTYVEGILTGPTGKQATVDFLVDSGATYTLLPFAVWQDLGLTPKRRVTFRLADGTAVDRDISECHLALAEGDGHTPVILGRPGDEPLLGVVTLEILGLIFHPFKRTLEPMRMLLARVCIRYLTNGLTQRREAAKRTPHLTLRFPLRDFAA